MKKVYVKPVLEVEELGVESAVLFSVSDAPAKPDLGTEVNEEMDFTDIWNN